MGLALSKNEDQTPAFKGYTDQELYTSLIDYVKSPEFKLRTPE